MKKNTVKIIIIICLICVSVISIASASYAAYFGRGVFKDVFINKKYYFESDVLKAISSVSDAETNLTSIASTTYNFSVFNYNASTGDFDDFDITYSVYAWLDFGSIVDPETVSYKLYFGGTNYFIGSTSSHLTPIAENLVLDKNQQSSCLFSVDFNLDPLVNFEKIPSLCVAVVASEPAFLPNKLLGASIKPKQSEAYSASASFEYEESASTTDYAGFKYRIQMVGEAPANTTIEIRYNASALTLSSNLDANLGITKEALLTDPNYDTILTFDAKSNYLGYITFYRTQTDDVEDNYWKEENTWVNGWNTLSTLVSFSLVEGGED